MAILVLALVALTASVAYAAPVEETELEAMLQLQDVFVSQQTEDNFADETLLEKLMQQETASEQDKMQSILAQIQEEQIDAALQDFYAEEQVPAELQGWLKKTFKKAGKFLKKNKSSIIGAGIKYLLGR